MFGALFFVVTMEPEEEIIGNESGFMASLKTYVHDQHRIRRGDPNARINIASGMRPAFGRGFPKGVFVEAFGLEIIQRGNRTIASRSLKDEPTPGLTNVYSYSLSELATFFKLREDVQLSLFA